MWVRSVFLCGVLLAGPAIAQSAPDVAAPEQPKIDAIDPPRSVVADQYRIQAANNGAQTDVTYAGKLDGELRSDGHFVPPEKPVPPRDHSPPRLTGGYGVILVLAVLLAVLALWLRFGGAGGLLAKGPGDIREKPVAPDGWALPVATQTAVGGDIFATIRAMADRRAAMVVLLRAALMQAATVSNTRFARSDTERDALRRLPTAWIGRPVLSDLLREAELAHYGGRDVSEATLDHCIDRARVLFGLRGANR